MDDNKVIEVNSIYGNTITFEQRAEMVIITIGTVDAIALNRVTWDEIVSKMQ